MEMSEPELMTVKTIDANDSIQWKAGSLGLCLCFSCEFPLQVAILWVNTQFVNMETFWCHPQLYPTAYINV